VLGALVIGLSQLSVHADEAATPTGSTALTGIASTAALLEGIPQRGNVLGSATAPIQVVEYADVQCPFCAVAATGVLPTIVREYVRTGKAQLVFRGLAFLGADSVTALRTATAAQSENRMWNVLELLYRNQGAENAWVTDELLHSIVTAAGASPDGVFARRDESAVLEAVSAWQRQSVADGVTGAPTFLVGPRGGELQKMRAGVPPVSDFRAAIEQALRR
jgi:protein-disulfide isomerase